MNALDLLWRNDINPEKVVLGLAFYARVFSATSPSCIEPGCTFQSGGNAGPTLDKDATVKILKFNNNQWLMYDDANTFKLKAEFARGQCLGGVMVWAVSHDLPYGNYSRALGEVANRKVKALAMSTVTDKLETCKVHQQCKWTNYFENCPAGWTLITRSDSGARKGEAGMGTVMCTWAESPKCDEGVCPNTLVAESSTGSGGDYCQWKTFKYTWNGQEATYQERKYCCDQKDDTKWEDCEWFDNVRIFSVDSAAVDGYCASGCPNDHVRVALETRNGYEGDSGQAWYYKPKYITLSKRSYTDAETSLEQSVKEFMDDPSCSIDNYWKRDLVLDDYLLRNVMSYEFSSPLVLIRCASSKAQEAMQDLLSMLLLLYTVSEASQEIWKRHVISLYLNLTVEKIRAYMTGARDWVHWDDDPEGDLEDDAEDDLEARDLEKRSSQSFTRIIGGAEWIVRSLPVSLSSI
ncbi:hypothetical protein IFM61606_10399 [Aspergillus udagawae]|nr:hypothetical protein IFM61606_10399 [Aspergillus udagawae]